MDLERIFYRRAPIFLQTVMLNVKAFELYLERYGPKSRILFEQFAKNESLPYSQLLEYQNEKLKQLIRYAYENVEYYKDIMSNLKIVPSDIKGVGDLHKLPILTRGQLKNNLPKLISRSYPKILLRHGHTSGTTGSALDLYYDINTCIVHTAAVWRQRTWAGLQVGSPYATLQGRVIVPLEQKKPPFWRKNYLNNQLFFSAFHLSERNLPYYFEKIREENIHAIEGYPSNLYILALYLIKSEHVFPMKAVLTSSETLFDYQREAIERAFQCKIFDYYGMAERAVFSSECSEHRGHHLNLDYGITEFLDSNNQPVKTGEMGKVIATSLHNFAMPLIRYQTNDSCSLKSEVCTCGRSFPLIDSVTTKNESIISLPDGRLISPSTLTHPFKPMRNVLESQIIQESIDAVTVKLVRKESFNEEDEKRLVAGLFERLGNQIKISVEYVNEIPREKNGKFRWIISKVEAKF